jgi:phosphoribosylformimino-5-aminoimidazole carboxamide ribotide isomerase
VYLGFSQINIHAYMSTLFESFEVIPAVDMQDGDVVQLVQGERGTETRYGDPVVAAKQWVEAGAKTLHLVDLDGAFEGDRMNATAVDAIIDAVDIPVQLGGGIRTANDAASLLDRGVNRVILGTAAVENPDLVAELAESYPGRIIVSLDAADGEVVVSGWTESTGIDPAVAAARFADYGACGILFTDVDVEGKLAGIQSSVTARVIDAVDIPVIASGGVASLDDIQTLHTTGAAATVVGTALYENKFTLADAMEVCESD